MKSKTLVVGESTLTDRYQTTVPAPVRKALKLDKGAKLEYQILADGSVVMRRANVQKEEDPVLGKFLDFLAKDIEAHPERLKPLTSTWFKKMKALTRGVKIDLDKPLPPEDE